MRSASIRMAVAFVLTFGVAVALPHSAFAAEKRHHHATKSQPAKQPAEQYLRSAAPPDPEHQQC